MKKLLVLITAMAVACMGTFAYANGIAQTSHFTAKHIAGMNDNTGDETAMYDPASTVWLKDGIYVNVSSFMAIDDIEAKASGEKYDGETNAWTVPALSAVYKQGQFAGFVYANVLDGAPFATLKWDDGTPAVLYELSKKIPVGTTTIDKVEADSVTWGINLGGAYKINDMFSVSVGGRYVYTKTTSTIEATNTMIGKVKKETDESGDGFGGVIGLNVAPAHGYLIGLTYATKVSRELDDDESDEKSNYDIPAMLTLTAAGMPAMGTVIALQINYMFNKQADWEDAEDEYDNTIVYMLSVTQFINQQLRFSLGVMYADKGIKDSGNESFSHVTYDINPVLDELGVGLGAAYSINENINIGITYSYTWFMEGEDPMTGDEKLNKSRHIIGIQVGYKM
ncbi:MAG TPA: hypothetical protein PL059_12335 [Spirochaetota bacterium]|nr:hypothetical protein [Spirochaetota bacterium]